MRRFTAGYCETHFNLVHFQLDFVVQDNIELLQVLDARDGVLERFGGGHARSVFALGEHEAAVGVEDHDG